MRRVNLITIAMSKVIRCPRARVWRALVTPGEQIRWDVRRIELEEPAPNYPSPGEGARWRCWLGPVQVSHREKPLEVIPSERLRSDVHHGPLHYEETYTLADEGSGATRLSLRISAENSLAMVGGALDRFDIRELTTERVDEMLDRIQRWCEDD